MPTLNIGGRKVKVGDEFLSLTPEQQNDTVDEITASFGDQPAPVPNAESAMPSGRHLSYEEGLAELAKEEQDSASGKAGAFLTGAVGDLPIVGPAALGGLQRAAAGISSAIDGDSYEDNLKRGQEVTEAAQAENPKSRIAGAVAGNVGAMAALGGTTVGSQLLGMTGRNLATRAGMSGLSSGVISGADTAVRGGDAHETGWSAGIGAGIGAAIPVVGAGLSGVGRVIGDRVAPVVNAVVNPSKEAARRVGMAVTRDTKANPGMVMSAADEAVARQSGIPVLNVDRGGETTRALARSVANQSPEARAVIENTASDRFASQGQRAVSFITRLTGGKTDDIAYREALDATARMTNRPAYNAAYAAPEAQQLFTPRIQELMQSPAVRKAIESVPKRSADRGAVSGAKEIANPFTQNSQGAYVLQKKADGTLVVPTLEFWDHVQRNLASDISKAVRKGDKTRVGELTALKNELLKELDTTVPAFKTARQGAAGFFGADNALDAGKAFANTPKLVPEAKKAYQGFKPAERQAFATGYASEIIDRIRSAGDRTNVINATFKNQSARESMELVFGPKKMKEIEAFVRVEDLVDRLRGAMGGSTTTRQLMELGIGASGGYLAGDWTGALAGAAAARGARYMGQRVDAQVMEKVANMLMSDNPANIAVAVRQAASQPAYMVAIEKLGNALSAPVRAGGVMTAQ